MEGRNKAVEEKSARSTLKKVVFSPVQRKLNYQHKIILDNKQNKNVALECKEFIKYLALINRARGLYGKILTEVVRTDRTQ